MYVCGGGRKYTSPSTILLQLVIMVDQLEKVGEGPYTKALHVDWERKDCDKNGNLYFISNISKFSS